MSATWVETIFSGSRASMSMTRLRVNLVGPWYQPSRPPIVKMRSTSNMIVATPQASRSATSGFRNPTETMLPAPSGSIINISFCVPDSRIFPFDKRCICGYQCVTSGPFPSKLTLYKSLQGKLKSKPYEISGMLFSGGNSLGAVATPSARTTFVNVATAVPYQWPLFVSCSRTHCFAAISKRETRNGLTPFPPPARNKSPFGRNVSPEQKVS
mmetsp:Transcript_36216/g.88475  ORF Transcript_36216/g.88475 Transcript_36216/m.88475 type:complete len:212 (+) Transcript_36216:439-1074(+)